ncbi:MAG: hypothetical protein IPJ48_21085 [Propionivibrio sp.]|uniref:Uncharacterized protein n=1 Tax=Candidatus Propionivibrio dominans TaxID=2954373 RepID=A0A9D7FJI2_9RHOO|nr:hypothetical protein [Candidatus Propionivibrio dominans]
MIRKMLILIPALMAGIAFAAPPVPAEAPVEIISAEFGLFDASNPEELIFEPGDVVPHKVGQRYGWIIEVKTARRTLSVREEYLLPGPPSAGNAPDPLSESLNIPIERRNQVSQRQLVPVDGKIYGEWAVGQNEPAGHRRLQVVIEGQVAASFDYDVK